LFLSKLHSFSLLKRLIADYAAISLFCKEPSMRIGSIAGTAFLTLGVAGLWAQSNTTINGFISEEHCGASHSSPSAEATKCVQGCLKRGSAPVLVREGKVYKLKGDDAAVKDLAGQNVTVTGTVDGDTITVASVAAQKS
jgi:hypothetical protein